MSGNEIFDAPHSGIMISPASDGVGVNHVFEGNYLHDLCRGTADAGGFYAGRTWANRGNVVRGNRFERLYPTETMAQKTSVNAICTLEPPLLCSNVVRAVTVELLFACTLACVSTSSIRIV